MKKRRLKLITFASLVIAVLLIPTIAFGAETDDEVTIDQCGTIMLDGWIRSEEPYMWETSNGLSYVQLCENDGNASGKVYSFDESDRTYARVGEEIWLYVYEPSGYQVSEVKVNGEDCAYEKKPEMPGLYKFTVSADVVDENNARTPGNIVSVKYEKINAETIRVGDEKIIEATGKPGTFKFVPEDSGSYIFYSTITNDRDADPEGRIVDSDEMVVAEGQYEAKNFRFIFTAEEGKAYYLRACDSQHAKVSFSVGLMKSDIAEIAYEPKKPRQLRKGIDTYDDLGYDDNGEETVVDYWKAPSTKIGVGDKLTLTKSDGSVQTYQMRLSEDNGKPEFINVEDAGDKLKGLPEFDNLGDGWATATDYPVGTSTEINVFYEGHSATVPLYFVENPYTAFTVTPATGIIVEKETTNSSNGEELTKYYWNWGETKFIFTQKDNSKVEYVATNEYDGPNLLLYSEDEGEWLPLDSLAGGYYDENTYEWVPWEAGKDYTHTLTIAGLQQEIGVSVRQHEHKLVHHNKIPATSDNWGTKEYWACSLCNRVFSDANGENEITDPDLTIRKDEHNLTFVEAKSATCTAEGNREYWWCDECSTAFADEAGTQTIDVSDIVMPKKPHKMTKTAAKAATYKAAGNKTYYKCSTCGKYFNDAAGAKPIAKNSWILKKLTPKTQKITVKTTTKTVKVKKLKKKAITVAPLSVKGAKGKLSYKVVGGSAKSKKALKLNAKTGKVTVKKKTKKGKYTIKVKVNAAATASGSYKAFAKTVKVTVRVK